MKRYEGNGYAVKAIVTAILAHQGIFLEGDPGSAKTKMLRDILTGEFGESHVGMLQTQKATRIGMATGHPNIEAEIMRGERMMEPARSLIDPNTKAVIIDEFNGATEPFVAALLGISNPYERTVRYGSSSNKTNIQFFSATSNKTIGDLIDAIHERNPASKTHEVFLARLSHVVHMINKFATPGDLVKE